MNDLDVVDLDDERIAPEQTRIVKLHDSPKFLSTNTQYLVWP